MKATLLISAAIALSACDVRIESTSTQKTEWPEFELATDEALAKIRHFLGQQGYGDIEIRKLGSYPASQTSVDTPAVQAALSVFKKYANGISVQPRIAGSAPYYRFTDSLGLPMVSSGMGFGTGAHAPNEIMLIEPAEGVAAASLAEIEKAYVDFVYALAKAE